jgi:hypothetical protein
MKPLSFKPAALVALSLWLTASPPVSAALREEERAAWTTFAGGAPGEASVLTDEQALAKIAAAFAEGTPARKDWDTYWTNHGQQILDVESYYQRTLGDPGFLIDALIMMAKLLHEGRSPIDKQACLEIMSKNKEDTEDRYMAYLQFWRFPKGLDNGVDFFIDCVGDMPDAFVQNTLGPFWEVLTAV